MAGRLTQAVVEVVAQPSDQKARLTQAVVEVVAQPSDQKARLTQSVVEVVLAGLIVLEGAWQSDGASSRAWLPVKVLIGAWRSDGTSTRAWDGAAIALQPVLETQAVAEPVAVGDVVPAVLSQAALEPIGTADDSRARVSQAVLEPVGVAEVVPAVLSQSALELIGTAAHPVLVTQVCIELIGRNVPLAYVEHAVPPTIGAFVW